jgi:hypothetical protein
MISVDQNTNIIVVTVVGQESAEAFKQLVQRATNLWPDASPEIKEFADRVTNHDLLANLGGKRALQDYKQQDTSPKGQPIRKLYYCVSCKSDNLVDITERVLEEIEGSRKLEFKCSHCMTSNLVNL